MNHPMVLLSLVVRLGSRAVRMGQVRDSWWATAGRGSTVGTSRGNDQRVVDQLRRVGEALPTSV